MKEFVKAPCSECRGRVRRRKISQEFEKEGVKVKLSGFSAWVCEGCGEIYFEPGGAEKVARAVNCLFALAISEGQHKGTVSARLS
jgi:YgiT-type zinc finger domain-containing protein